MKRFLAILCATCVLSGMVLTSALPAFADEGSEQTAAAEENSKKKEEEAARLSSGKKEIAWGSQIRSYVLQPSQMVKDHRTGYAVGNADVVLDGDLEGFVEAYLLGKHNEPE